MNQSVIQHPIDVLNSPIYDFPLEDDIAAIVEEIRKSNPADPVVPALLGVEAFIQMSVKYYLESPIEINVDIRGLCHALARAKPGCAPLVNLANDMLKPLESFYGRNEGEQMRADMRARVEQWREQMLALENQRIRRVARLVGQNARVMCFAFAQEFVAVFQEVKSASVNFSVLCANDPLRSEGDILARELASRDITARVVRFDEIEPALAETDLIFVGTSALSEQGLVNRVGTKKLALIARNRNVALYALCGPEKFFPAGYPVELSAVAYVSERELELTPTDLFTGIVSGDAILTGEELASALSQHRVESILLG